MCPHCFRFDRQGRKPCLPSRTASSLGAFRPGHRHMGMACPKASLAYVWLTSITRAWWVDCLRDFMVRTMAASMLYRLSFSTSSVTFFFSSMGGRGICRSAERLRPREQNREGHQDGGWHWQPLYEPLETAERACVSAMCQLAGPAKLVPSSHCHRSLLALHICMLAGWFNQRFGSCTLCLCSGPSGGSS